MGYSININQNTLQIMKYEFLLKKDDYLLVECENKAQINCNFLIYYDYKSKLRKNDDNCRQNNFPNLFKFVLFYDNCF